MATLYVGGLPEGIDDESFSQLFEGSGEILSCTCHADQYFGYVSYASEDDATAVVEAMNGFQFGDSKLQVKFDDSGGGKGSKKGGGKKAQQPWEQPAWGGKSDTGGKGWGKDGKDGKGGKGGKGKGGKDDGKGGKPTWTPIAAEPSDNLYIKGLPAGTTDEEMQTIFACYATVVSCKVLSHANECSLLMRVGSVEMATWIVENLNGNIPQGLTSPVMVRYADTPGSKAAKLQQQQGITMGGGKDGGFGKDKGKGKGKGGPYGDVGGKGGAQFGNFDPSLPEEVSNAVECVLRNFGAGSKQRFAHGDDESNLYVKDLPGTADELYIYKVFSPFGGLDSISLKKGEGWAIAFVKYQSNEEAQAAITGLTNCLLPDGSMLKVSVKTSNPAKPGK